MATLGNRLLFSFENLQISVKTTLQDGVQLIGINRAAKKNCINHETARQLISAFEKFENDENAKIAVLYGEGRRQI